MGFLPCKLVFDLPPAERRKPDCRAPRHAGQLNRRIGRLVKRHSFSGQHNTKQKPTMRQWRSWAF